ncbi:hypothetical protein [Acinetobacter sp.]|uniref:hypothetical protein n=1 Tax=Acinetobacter sp. TaxID=472 RepID=UPI00388D5532
MATNYNRINSKGTYSCAICGKLTRDTGHGEADIDTGYCKKCLFECYMINAAADYGVDSSQYEAAKADFEACN